VQGLHHPPHLLRHPSREVQVLDLVAVAAIPSLQPALADRIRTGTHGRYEPPADAAIGWIV
jgi:hypothetical protein